MGIKIFTLILLLAFAGTGISQKKQHESRRMALEKADPTSASTIKINHINTPVNKFTVGERFIFTDYDYATNNAMRPMVDWADYDNDGFTNPIVTAMGRQNGGSREQLLGFRNVSGFNLVNPFNPGAYGWGTIQYARHGPDSNYVFIFAHSGGITHVAKINAQTQAAPNQISSFGTNYPGFTYVDDGTIWAVTYGGMINKSVDGGLSFSQVIQIGSGDPNVNFLNASYAPPEIPIQASNNGEIIAVAGCWGTATPLSEDIAYIYYSTNSGTNWTGKIIGIDEVYGQVSNRNYAPYFENFGQLTLNVSNDGVIHVAINGYGKGVIGTDTTDVIPALYWNSTINTWTALTDQNLESATDAGGTSMLDPLRIYAGNAIGNSYPGVTVSDNGQIIFYMWQAPEYDAAGNYRIYPGDGGPETGPIIYTDLLGRYSTDGGINWSEIIEIAAEPEVMEQFPNLPRRLEIDFYTAVVSVHFVFMVDAIPGTSIFNGQIPGQNSPNNYTEWRYHRYQFGPGAINGIVLTSPNGGENWPVGSTRNITWLSNVGNVKIDYTTNSGTNWINITNSTPSTGIYPWTIPNTVSALCKVRITDVTDPTVSDQSNNHFSIVQSAVDLLSPDGGEEWISNSIHNITWTSGNVANVKLEYSTNSGTTWINIVSSFPSTGSYQWVIPATPSSQCRVRVSDATNPATFDISSSDFTIVQAAITVISPNGGEVWLTGSTHDITWHSQYISNVKIEYSRDGGSVWNNITYSAPNTGSYSWIIPAFPSQNCRMRISDASNLAVSDQSDSNFAVVRALVQIVSPNGGEIWEVGSNHDITWTSNNITNVMIELTVDNGSSWTEIVQSAPSTGIYNWTVPNSISNQCKIRISDTQPPFTKDLSNNVFSIEEATSVEDWLSSEIPTEFALYQNFPNPFNPITTIYYSVPERCFVNITIFNLLGQKIASLVEEYKESGNYKANFNFEGQNSGVYLYKIQAGNFVQTKKMILLK